jgi:hypothetical protein
VAKIVDVQLNEEEDSFRWSLNQNGMFKVNSMYKAMIVRNVWENNLLWKLKLPLKIKKILWYLNKGVILTKDNLVRRNWTGSTRCVYCSKKETI